MNAMNWQRLRTESAGTGFRLLVGGLISLLAILPCRGGAWEQLPALPDALGMAAPFAGVSGGVLMVAGGANFPDGMPWEGGKKVWHERVWVYVPAEGKWRAAGRLPRPLAYGVSVSVNGLILGIGGSDAERHHAGVLAWEWRGGQLVDADVTPGDLPVPLALAAGAVDAAQNVYVACGSSEPGEQKASARVFVAGFHGSPPRWKELPELPGGPRILPVAAADGEDFLVFGGAALEPKDGKVVRRYLRDAWRYRPGKGWERLADLPRPCVAAPSPAPVAAGSVWLVGGDDGSLAGFQPPAAHPGFPGTVLRYHLAEGSWSEAGRAPQPRATLPAVPWDGGFVFPSGEVRPGVRSPVVQIFRPQP